QASRAVRAPLTPRARGVDNVVTAAYPLAPATKQPEKQGTVWSQRQICLLADTLTRRSRIVAFRSAKGDLGRQPTSPQHAEKFRSKRLTVREELRRRLDANAVVVLVKPDVDPAGDLHRTRRAVQQAGIVARRDIGAILRTAEDAERHPLPAQRI